MAKITVQNTEITVLSYNNKDYISLTDMANGKQSESRAADTRTGCGTVIPSSSLVLGK